LKDLPKLKKDKKIKVIKKENNICEECKKEDKSVFQNLIMNGFKVCNSCKISKTLFPI
tara:strand:+ start:787 stop:960 length:174 start_codon:yes stop_codon:yes gene_type:complete